MKNVLYVSFLFFVCYTEQVVEMAAPYLGVEKEESEYKLPELPYGYGGLEPLMDEATLKVHHGGHHAAYTNKMNAALASWRADSAAGGQDLAKKPILAILQNLGKVPEKYQTAVKNNGGGFVNHNLYWACLSPNAGGEMRKPSGKIQTDIDAAFGSFDAFHKTFSDKATTLFGSGYVWLSRDASGKLVITTNPNQDSAITEKLFPILILDVWEHAYYLKHQNRRPAYIDHWWKLVDWSNVEALDTWWSKVGHDEL